MTWYAGLITSLEAYFFFKVLHTNNSMWCELFKGTISRTAQVRDQVILFQGSK